jgi:hypothetical protein
MKRIGHFLRHQFLEIVGHFKIILLGALVILFARASPEELVADLVARIPTILRAHWAAFLDFRTTLTVIGVLIVVADVVQRRVRDARAAKKKVLQSARPTLNAQLTITQREDIHVALVRLDAHNNGSTGEWLTRLEFVTKGHWDIQNYNEHTSTETVVKHLGSTPFITISPELNSRANKAIGLMLEPNRDFSMEFFLVTDHSPGTGSGIFPFHLGCDVIYGERNTRLPLPDLIVSLHGQIILSSTQWEQRDFHPLQVPGQAQSFANQALSRVERGVILPANLEAALKTALTAP